MATGKSGEDRDDLESRVDDATAGTEPTDERDASDDVDADETESGSTALSADRDAADYDADDEKVAAKGSKSRQKKSTTVEKKGKKTPKRTEAEPKADAKNHKRSGSFFSQVVEELKKVVTPTGKELWRYVAVVLSFLLIMMLVVFVLDWAFGFLSSWVFGDGTQLFPQEPPAPPTETPGEPVPAP